MGSWTSTKANPLTIYIPLICYFFFSPLISGLVIAELISGTPTSAKNRFSQKQLRINEKSLLEIGLRNLSPI